MGTLSLRQTIRQCLEHDLTREQTLILLLATNEGLTTGEIASVLEMPESTVETLQAGAMETMRKACPPKR